MVSLAKGSKTSLVTSLHQFHGLEGEWFCGFVPSSCSQRGDLLESEDK